MGSLNLVLTEVLPDNSSEHYCISCGEVIPIARMKALPNTISCIKCANDTENVTKLRRRGSIIR